MKEWMSSLLTEEELEALENELITVQVHTASRWQKWDSSPVWLQIGM